MGSRSIDLAGQVFGRWTVLSLVPGKFKNGKWKCKCVCGNVGIITTCNLKHGISRSCGCLSRELTVSRNKLDKRKHGMSFTSEYCAYMSMKDRCYRAKHKYFKHYGGRGIRVCKRWLQSFENFFADMGLKPSKRHSLDRINVNGNYTPSNCRWATWEQQANNKRPYKHENQFTKVRK